MKKNHHISTRIALFPVLLLMLIDAAPAQGFHGGYHWDLSRDCLIERGFNQPAIQLVQISNWYADAFESAKIEKELLGIIPLPNPLDWSFSNTGAQDASDQYMHFDQLANYTAVASEWDRLTTNTYYAVSVADSRGTPEGLLIALGLSLHVVQDFYSHSNWSEIDLGGDATWFDVSVAAKESRLSAGEIEIYTHTSGSRSHDQLNKDHAGRPGFETAYREAFYASCQWIDLVQTWVTPELWSAAKAYQSPAVASEADWDREIMTYAGTWKGPWSRSNDDVTATFTQYLNESHPIQDRWVEYALMIGTSQQPAQVPRSDPPYSEGRGWLVVNTDRIMQTDCSTIEDIDPGGEADFYAVLRLNDREYLEALVEDEDNLVPQWLTVIPINQEVSTIHLDYAVYDDDGGLRYGNDQCDIAPARDTRIWIYDGSPMSLNGISIETNGLVNCDSACLLGICENDSVGDGDEASAAFSLAYTTPPRIADAPPAIGILGGLVTSGVQSPPSPSPFPTVLLVTSQPAIQPTATEISILSTPESTVDPFENKPTAGPIPAESGTPEPDEASGLQCLGNLLGLSIIFCFPVVVKGFRVGVRK